MVETPVQDDLLALGVGLVSAGDRDGFEHAASPPPVELARRAELAADNEERLFVFAEIDGQLRLAQPFRRLAQQGLPGLLERQAGDLDRSENRRADDAVRQD